MKVRLIIIITIFDVPGEYRGQTISKILLISLSHTFPFHRASAPGTGQSSRHPSPLCDLGGEGVDVHELRRQVHNLKAQLVARKPASPCDGRTLTDEACSSNFISAPAGLADGFLGQASRVRRLQEAEAEIQELVQKMEDLQAQLTEAKGLNRHLQEQLDSLHAANGEARWV